MKKYLRHALLTASSLFALSAGAHAQPLNWTKTPQSDPGSRIVLEFVYSWETPVGKITSFPSDLRAFAFADAGSTSEGNLFEAKLGTDEPPEAVRFYGTACQCFGSGWLFYVGSAGERLATPIFYSDTGPPLTLPADPNSRFTIEQTASGTKHYRNDVLIATVGGGPLPISVSGESVKIAVIFKAGGQQSLAGAQAIR